MLTRPTGIRQPRTRQDENRPMNHALQKVLTRTSSDMTAVRSKLALAGGVETSRIPLKKGSSSSSLPYNSSVSAVNDSRLRQVSVKEQLLNRTSSALTEVTHSSQVCRNTGGNSEEKKKMGET